MLYNVLVVEDDRRMADTLAAMLRALGHTVGIALSPRMAIQQLNQVIPDVIFMDINMPGVNGLEVIRFLRREPLTTHVPVIVISAEEAPNVKQAAHQAGANAYLTKPPMLDDIEATLERVMAAHPPVSRPAASPPEKRADAETRPQNPPPSKPQTNPPRSNAS